MRALMYAVRLRPVLKYFGQFCIVLSLLTLVPLGVSVIVGDYGSSLRYSVIVPIVFALGFWLKKLPTPKHIQTNEAMVITCLIFVFAPLVMTWPTMASDLDFLTALFETISAVTTTGLSVTASVADKPAIFLFSRAWMQWIGGLGIVVFSLAIMIKPGFAAKIISGMEYYEDDLIGSTRAHARRISVIYSILTIFGILVLVLLGAGWFEAILYSFAAISTGGFSPHDASLAGLSSVWLQAMVILLSMAGAIPLFLYHKSYRKGFRIMLDDYQFKGIVTAVLLITVLMVWFLWFQYGLTWTQALKHGTLNALSAQSTAGFSSLDISRIDPGSKLILIFAMFIGGGAGSTAGGIKILRLLILTRVFLLLVRRACIPKGTVAEAKFAGRRLEADEIQDALCIILLFIVFIAVSWLPFVAMGYNPLDSLFEVVSAIGTVGLSSGIASHELDPFLKLILCVDMLMGRLEIFAWIVLFYPRNWFGRKMEE